MDLISYVLLNVFSYLEEDIFPMISLLNERFPLVIYPKGVNYLFDLYLTFLSHLSIC